MTTRRTNIEIDEDLVAEAMEVYGTRSMRETVDLALRRLVGERMTVDEAIAMRGSGWEGDLMQSRADWARTFDDAANDDANDGYSEGME